MQFLFTCFNHQEFWRRSLEDIVAIMGSQLRALGHRAGYEPANDRFIHPIDDGINVVFEGFVNEVQIQVLADAKARGARFIILATEEPTDLGFNHGTQPSMVQRQKMFPEAAKFCEGILHLVPGQRVTDWYAQFAPAAPADLGFAQELVRADMTVPDFDFGFFGSLSPRRKAVLKRLANATGSKIKVIKDFPSRTERDREMQRAKVILQVRKFDEMGLVSSARCNTALCLGRPVIAEPHALSGRWDEIVRFASNEDGFHSLCMLARSMWRTFHAEQMVKFKDKLSPDVCVGQALRRIGIIGERRSAA